MTDQLPDGLVPGAASPTFTQDTLPAALQAEHTLAPGHWEPPADGVDNQGPTIGEIMDSAAEIGKRGVRTVQAGIDSVTKVAGKLPRVVRRVTGKDETGTETPPEEVIVEGLPDEAMKCYLSVLVWLVHTDDKQIDHMLKHGSASGTDTQLALKCALMKDAIRVCRATSKGPVREQRGIRQLAEMLDLDDEKIRFFEDACVQDEKILDGKLSDSQIAATAKELAARATSVGVPVAAVYLSGSVTGHGAGPPATLHGAVPAHQREVRIHPEGGG